MVVLLSQGAQIIMDTLHRAGYEAYVVGGGLRDFLLGKTPDDFDVATNAHPEEVQSLFEKTIPVGVAFGTVVVVEADEAIEVTTFRGDGRYFDGRRPDNVHFVSTIAEDLSRRDFTMNAMAWSSTKGLIDPFGGKADLERGVIRTVGDANERFSEDALRMFRAARFASRFGFEIDHQTFEAMSWNAHRISSVSAERISKEILLLLAGKHPEIGLEALKGSGILARILPEVAQMVGFDQKTPYHLYDLYRHTLYTVCGVRPDPTLRLAALLHDVGKPKTQTFDARGVAHYYTHSEVGAEMADKICRRLKLSNDIRIRVRDLVSEHMLQEEAGVKALRRLRNRYGLEFVNDVIELHDADFRATGRRSSEWKSNLFDVLDRLHDEPEIQLAINGHDVMQYLGIEPGPSLGHVLNTLKAKVIDNPSLNERDTLLDLAVHIHDRN